MRGRKPAGKPSDGIVEKRRLGMKFQDVGKFVADESSRSGYGAEAKLKLDQM